MAQAVGNVRRRGRRDADAEPAPRQSNRELCGQGDVDHVRKV
jgi:hypothetical protein